MSSKYFLIIFFTSVFFMLGGCNNDLLIEVEQVINSGESRLSPQSRYGRSVINGTVALNQLSQSLTQVQNWAAKAKGKIITLEMEKSKATNDNAKSEHEEQTVLAIAAPNNEATNKFTNGKLTATKVLDSMINSLKLMNQEVACRTTEYANLMDAPDAVGLAWKIEREFVMTKVALQGISTRLVELNSQYAELSKTLGVIQTSEYKEVTDDIEKLFKNIGELTNSQLLSLTAVAKESAQPVGQGGFNTVGVFVIDPSDPAYKTIFAQGYDNVRMVPLTQTRVNTIGDSAVMVVQESPGQVRLYQVSNDPQQAIQNIALLVAKATAAAAKFLMVP